MMEEITIRQSIVTEIEATVVGDDINLTIAPTVPLEITMQMTTPGPQGDAFTYDDFTPEQLEALQVKGDKGDAFVFDDFTPSQLAALKGAKGDAFIYADFTPEQLAALKGAKGDAFEYSDFSPEQLALLKGEKGDSFTFEDFTPEEIATLKGEPGDTPVKGVDYVDGLDGEDGLGITEQAIGFTLTGGTTPKTLTVALDATVSGSNTGDQNLTPYALKTFAIAMGVAL